MSDKSVTQSAANAASGSLAEVQAAISNQLASGVLEDPGLRIKGGSASALAQAQNAFRAIAGGSLSEQTANTDMPALSGTVANGEHGFWFFTVDSSGSLSTLTLATAANLGDITMPDFPDDEAIVGAVYVNPTGTGDFEGGTDDLDDGTVTPNAVFFDGSNFTVGNRIVFSATGAPGS